MSEFLFTGNLNRDCPMVVIAAGRAPRAVLLLAVHPNAPIGSNAVVAGRLPRAVPVDLLEPETRSAAFRSGPEEVYRRLGDTA